MRERLLACASAFLFTLTASANERSPRIEGRLADTHESPPSFEGKARVCGLFLLDVYSDGGWDKIVAFKVGDSVSWTTTGLDQIELVIENGPVPRVSIPDGGGGKTRLFISEHHLQSALCLRGKRR